MRSRACAYQGHGKERYASAGDIRRDLDAILTAPLVQAGGQSSAAIPKQSLPQKPVAKGPQKPMGKSANVPVDGRRVRQNAEDAAATPDRTLASAPTAKSKTPLFIGLGAVAAIAVGAFVMMGGKKPDVGDDVRSLTSGEQQRLVTSSPTPAAPIKVREDPKPASPVPASLSAKASSSPPLPVSSSSTQFPPGKWVKVFTKFEDLPAELRKPDRGLKFEDGEILSHQKPLAWRIPVKFRNGGIRLHATKNSSFELRVRDSVFGDGAYALMSTGRVTHASDQDGKIKHTDLLSNALPSAEGVTELLVLEDKIVARRQGQLIGFATHHSSVAGEPSVLNGLGRFRDIEVINLDGIPEAEALKILGVDEKGNDLRGAAVAQSSAGLQPAPTPTTPSASKSTQPAMADASAKGIGDGLKPATTLFPPGQWVKVFTKFEDLPEDLRKGNYSLKWEEGWMRCEIGKPVRIYVVESLANYAIRATMQRQGKEYQSKRLVIRGAPKPSIAGYTLRLDSTTLFAERQGEGPTDGDDLWKSLSPDFQLPRVGEEYTLEWGCVGDKLIGRFGKDFVKVVTDSKWNRGSGYFTGGEPIRDIEVINLDGIPEAEALRILGVDEKGNDLRALAAKQEQQKAEQAKQTDAIAAIPELKTLHDPLVKLTAERVTAPFEKDVAALNTSYLGGLDRKIAELKQKGDLDGVLALEAEKKLIQGAGVANSRASDGTWQVPLPADADATTAPALKPLRQIYRDTFAKHEATRAANLKALTDPLSIRLKQLESTLTQQNRIDHAKTVREYREGLGRGMDTPVREANPGGAAATSDSKDKSVRATKKFPPGDDRKAAEWAIDLGGWVRILEGRTERRIDKKEDLPKSSFDIVAVKLSSEAAAKRVIEYTDLTPLAGLRQLNNIDLADMPVTDADCDVLGSLPELARLTISKTDGFTGSQLGKLKHLDKLTYLYLGESGITAEGVAAIGELASLEYLRLTPTNFGDADIAPLARLKKLSSLLMSRGQLTLEGWKKLKGLFIKDSLGFSPQAGQMQQWCDELARLFPAAHRLEVSCDEVLSAEDIAALGKFAPVRVTLSNSMTSDAVVAAIALLPKLEQVYLSSGPKSGGLPGVTDASLSALAAHKGITLITLTDVGSITADGLLKLAALKPLKALELIRCRQLDAAAVDAFKKARPDVKVSVE